MAKTYTANYVDRLLMKLDGALTPIWNSIFFTVTNLPTKELLFEVFSQLIRETPRLRSVWDKQRDGWKEINLEEHHLNAAYNYDPNNRGSNLKIHQIIKAPIHLSYTLPIRLSITYATDNKPENWLMAFQIHHAAGDGRSLLNLVQRFWDLLNHKMHQKSLKYAPLVGPQMTDLNVLKKIVKHKKSLLYLTQAKHRQLARRADALGHHGLSVGAPNLQSCRIPLADLSAKMGSELFYAVILAAIAQSEPETPEKRIRIRIPVDLRSCLSINSASVENACSAVILEIPSSKIRSIFHNEPNQLGLYLKKELTYALKQKKYFSNALECMIISRFSKTLAMKNAARKEMLALKRSSSLVITHFGDVTEFIRPPEPIKINQVQSHTPVWGGNSLIYDNSLYCNFTCFDGIWNKEQLSSFTTLGMNWLREHYGLQGELL